MLRALIVLGFVSACAPAASTAALDPAAPTATSPRDARAATSISSEARGEITSEHATAPRRRASRLAPPFGSSAGVRRVIEPTVAASDAVPEIVARAADGD